MAAATAASAQVTISGLVGLKIDAPKTANATFAVSDAKLNISTKEDLGGGTVLNASFDILTDARKTTSAKSEEFAVSLAGAWGKASLSQGAVGSQILSGEESLTTDINEWLGGDTVGYLYSYSTPSFNGLTLKIGGSASASAVPTVDVNDFFTDSGKVAVTASYAAGPLGLSVSYRPVDERVRVIGSYDLGMAKVSAAADSNNQVEAVVSAPVGPFQVSYHYGKDEDLNSNNAGHAFAASYALTKRTTIIVSTAVFENTSASNNSRIKVAHSF